MEEEESKYTRVCWKKLRGMKYRMLTEGCDIRARLRSVSRYLSKLSLYIYAYNNSSSSESP